MQILSQLAALGLFQMHFEFECCRPELAWKKRHMERLTMLLINRYIKIAGARVIDPGYTYML